jgi:hypothetical protein
MEDQISLMAEPRFPQGFSASFSAAVESGPGGSEGLYSRKDRGFPGCFSTRRNAAALDFHPVGT